ncbi:MAG: hypothetical protein QXR56_05890 [Thermofilaceae archaeon]
MAGYELAVFLVGSPSFTFQSAASSLARALEAFPIGECVAFYSAFAKREAERVSRFVKRLFDVDLELRQMSRDLGEALNTFQSFLSRGKALAVPTSGSLVGAVALTLASARTGADVGHVLFPFGPWTGFFYPYVPRYLQPMRVLGDPPEPARRAFSRDGAVEYLEEEAPFPTRLLKRIASLCVDLNLSLPQTWVNDYSTPKLALELVEAVEGGELSKTLYLSTTAGLVPVCELARLPVKGEAPTARVRKSISVHPPPDRRLFEDFAAEALSAIAWGEPRCREVGWLYRLVGFEMLDLGQDERYLIDTNVIYSGVHNVVRLLGPRIHVPYCVHAEVLNRVAESRKACERLLAEALLMAYEVVEAFASKVPSTQYKCDISIPSIDPELIKDLTVLTADKRAYALWRKLAISRYTNVKLMDDGMFRPASEGESHFALIQLAAILCELALQHRPGARRQPSTK